MIAFGRPGPRPLTDPDAFVGIDVPRSRRGTDLLLRDPGT